MKVQGKKKTKSGAKESEIKRARGRGMLKEEGHRRRSIESNRILLFENIEVKEIFHYVEHLLKL